MDAPAQRKRRAPSDKPAACTFGACARPYFVKGLCQLHYTRQHRGHEMTAPARIRCKPGDKKRGKDGYVSVFAPDEPGSRADGWIFEHRLVMQHHIGRSLRPSENVHHRNGSRDDNNLRNLELWSSTQPRGQRASDLLAWAKEITALYEPLQDRNLI